MGCPSCGAELNYDTRLSAMTVCEFCNAAVVYDERTVEIAGKMSAIAKPVGPFCVGATGQVNKHDFWVIGRVRYGYEAGFWDEWYLQHGDGSTSWISEDEKRFMHEKPQTLPVDRSAIEALQVGSNIQIGDFRYSVREKDVAICEGGEGQLPFRIISGEEVPFLDLVSEEGHSGTIEVEPDGTVKFFSGQNVNLSDITTDYDGFSQNKTIDQAEGTRERVSLSSSNAKQLKCLACGAAQESVDLSKDVVSCSSCNSPINTHAQQGDCKGCGAAIEVQSPDALSCVCEYCGSINEIKKGELTLIGKMQRKEKKRKDFNLPLKIGMIGNFDGAPYQIVGFVRYVEYDEGLKYYTNDFLLYNKDKGYRWLSEYNGHYTLEEKIKGAPTCFKDAKDCLRRFQKSKFKFDGTNWQVYESGSYQIDWVEGELPWVAKQGDRYQYMDAIAPPYMLSAEVTGREIEWTKAKYLTTKEVVKAFNAEAFKFMKPIGVGACQPNEGKKSWYMLSVAAMAFGILCLLLFAKSFMGGKKVAEFTVPAAKLKEEYLTEKTIKFSKASMCQIEFRTNTNNSWIYVGAALVNEKEEAVLEFSADMGYYHGYEGGESWSEGSNDDSAVFKIKKPGTYKLLLGVQSNFGSGTNHNPSALKDIKITVYEKITISRYYFIAMLVFGVLCFACACKPFIFENRRWLDVMDWDD